jgi:hypothetical protein
MIAIAFLDLAARTFKFELPTKEGHNWWWQQFDATMVESDFQGLFSILAP